MERAEFYTRVIGRCMVKTSEGLVFQKSLVKDDLQLQIAVTCVEKLIIDGQLEEAQFHVMLNSFAREEKCQPS